MKTLNWLLSFLASPLPLSKDDYSKWADAIFALTPTSVPDTDSTRFYLGTMLLHLKEDRRGYPLSAVPKRYFVKALCRARTNEVAYGFMEALKAAEKARQADAKAKAEAEAQEAAYNDQEHGEAPKLTVVPNDGK